MATLHSIWIAPAAGEPLHAVESVLAEPGRGLIGDRYAAGAGTFSRSSSTSSRELSIVALETVETVSTAIGRALEPGELRRNLVTRELVLDDLVGATLAIGRVRIEITGTCPPCGHLERLTGLDARALLHGRGGLRARIATGGALVVGAEIEVARAGRRLP